MTKPIHLSSARLLRRIAAVIILLSAVAIPAYAQSSNSNGKKYVATKEIVFDQATKTLRKPTQPETDAMVAQISTLTNSSTDGLTVTTGANGMKTMDLQDRFQGVLVGRANADGTTEVRCVMTLEEAVDFLGLQEVQ